MDRGIRIAIVVACLLSVGLGVLWDTVIDVGRSALAQDQGAKGPQSMRPDPAQATIRGVADAPAQTPDELIAAAAGAQESDAQGQLVRELEAPAGDESGALASSAVTPEATDLGVWAKCPKDLWQHINIEDNTYTVQAGDNGYAFICHKDHRFGFLKEKYDLTSDDWIKANGGNDILRVGKPIKIPVKVPMLSK